MKKALILLCLAASAAFGYDSGDYSTWMQMKANGLFAESIWYDPADPDMTAVPAERGKCYFVPAGKALSSPKANGEFVGAKLAVAGTVNDNQYGTTHTYPELHLLEGAALIQTANSIMQGGPIIVKGTASSPAKIRTQAYSNRDGWKTTMSIQGDETAYLRFGNDGVSKARGTTKPFYTGYVRSNGSLAAYKGTLEITGSTYFVVPADVDVMPGKLVLDKEVIFDSSKTSGDFTLGGLELKSGSELMFDAGRTLRYVVTDHFSFESGAMITIYGGILKNNDVELIRLTGGAAQTAPENLEGLTLSTYSYHGPLPRNPQLTIVDNDDGSKSVRLTFDPISQMIKINNYNYSCWDATATDAWYDHIVPGTDFNGDVYTATTMYFYLYSNMIYNDLTLTVDNASLHADSLGLTLKQINFVGTCNLYVCHASGAAQHEVNSPIRLYDATLSLTGNSSNLRWGRVNEPITGSGSITVFSSGVGMWKMNTDMSGFTGDVTYYGANGVIDARADRYAEIQGKKPFGGDYSGSEAWKAVKFTGTPWILVSGTVAMDSAQRGTFIDGLVNFEIADGESLMLSGLSTTYGGTLTKRGEGALVLGSEAQFASAGVPQSQPIEGTNNLVVAAGTLEVAHVNAVNGLAVSFAEGASLVVDPNATGDLLANGAVNVKWATPFATTAASGKIPVVFKSETAPVEGASVAICTVTDAAAANLDFDVPENLGTRTVTTRWRPNDDGTQTFVADISARKGLFIIFQ